MRRYTATELRTERTTLKLSHDALARLLGVTRQTIIAWERGDYRIPDLAAKLIYLALTSADIRLELAKPLINNPADLTRPPRAPKTQKPTESPRPPRKPRSIATKAATVPPKLDPGPSISPEDAAAAADAAKKYDRHDETLPDGTIRQVLQFPKVDRDWNPLTDG